MMDGWARWVPTARHDRNSVPGGNGSSSRSSGNYSQSACMHTFTTPCTTHTHTHTHTQHSTINHLSPNEENAHSLILSRFPYRTKISDGTSADEARTQRNKHTVPNHTIPHPPASVVCGEKKSPSFARKRGLESRQLGSYLEQPRPQQLPSRGGRERGRGGSFINQ